MVCGIQGSKLPIVVGSFGDAGDDVWLSAISNFLLHARGCSHSPLSGSALSSSCSQFLAFAYLQKVRLMLLVCSWLQSIDLS
uniref:Uncharacterized protein n=1 Tax=Physcomitrium patens TaxID=3218 RepID=A0A2K1KAN3_PHYPA|nr:hypothetical protein PHYPA_010005 [Physcomitrium patens]